MLQNRYEAIGPVAAEASGDLYHSLYAGLNWYIYGNKLKLMGGLEYSKMRTPAGSGGDYEGFTTFLGLRMHF